MDKPNNPKCESCYVIRNKLRCGLCKYKTDEWVAEKNISTMIIGNYDNYMSKEEYERQKQRELKEEKRVLEQIAEEQKTLLDTTKAWNKALEKRGYVN